MDLRNFRFPTVFQTLGQHIPNVVASTPLMLALELARRHALLVAPEALEGKVFSIRVSDLGLSLCFQCVQGKFRAVNSPGKQAIQADVSLAANAVDFFQLASGVEDADTLFFRRRLRMEGDTELGVAVKYWIDASERPAWLSKLAQGWLAQTAPSGGFR
ncbi:SCP2 sterol-binding domain-containing protein [Undibacterium sp. TS12]|uniref:ubiquinone anaerobic biosynthesis accessory factor UbiT n=1 Tax=Undibacterium sp. TS12 TaxID=2908202 RepID=UPI001F4CC8CE|nr:SCP2 sterol-binding domain-containing protein [Undibacterium sp. TS12]MCH8622734.1 SCP2 sterol-binding domain-containing protein [Undibacterium sp. TS12]